MHCAKCHLSSPIAPDIDDEEEGENDRQPDAAATAAKLEGDANKVAEAGNYKKAAELFALAARQLPREARLHEARAQCLLELEDFGEACAAARRATWLRPDWSVAHLTFGRALLNFGRLQDSVETFERALTVAEHGLDEPRGEIEIELNDARALLQKHWVEHHDILVQLAHSDAGASVPMEDGRLNVLHIRQYLDCSYCNLSGEQGPGGAVWASAVVLAAHIGSNGPPGIDSQSWQGVRALELGSGTGLGGLAAAAAGAHSLLTDRETGLPVMRANIDLNVAVVEAGGGSVQAVAFDWLNYPPREVAEGLHWDVVIAADLIYSFASVTPLVGTLATLLCSGGAAEGASVLYAHNPRSPELDTELHVSLAAHGLKIRELPAPKTLVPVCHIDLKALRRVVLRVIEVQTEVATDAEASSQKRQCCSHGDGQKAQ